MRLQIPEEQTPAASYEERLEERRKAAVREAADAEREARLGAWNTITKPLVSGLRPEASYFWAVVAMYKVCKVRAGNARAPLQLPNRPPASVAHRHRTLASQCTRTMTHRTRCVLPARASS